MAILIDDNDESLKIAAQQIKDGGLVAFPTETVYGLGGSLYNIEAIEQIYQAKKRPKTDPLIVHIHSSHDADMLINPNEFQKKCFELLAKHFWPGPLTLVVPAGDKIPKNILAGGDFVGIRVPEHKIAEKFLQYCNVPIAAPSANLFGHVSPTTAQHVYDDLKNTPELLIIKTNMDCEVGIESTVVKIEKENSLTILRLGKIGKNQIKNVFEKQKFSIQIKEKKKYSSQLNDQNVSRETFLHDSPGQNLTHYSPWIPTYIFNYKKNVCNEKSFQNLPLHKKNVNFKKAAFIDFAKQNEHLKNDALKYFDLSEIGSPKEAAFNLFKVLREAENILNAERIIISSLPLETPEHEALFDRIYRAASGKIIENLED